MIVQAPCAVDCEASLSPMNWAAITSAISSIQEDDFPLFDELVALEAAGGDLDIVVDIHGWLGSPVRKLIESDARRN